MPNNFTIYHNPRCSKSRQTLELLTKNGIQPEINLYLENPPSSEQLKSLLKKLGLSARGLLRKGEQDYKTLNLAEPSLSEEALLAAMSETPILIERPIVICGEKAVLGRPPENVLDLISL